MNLKDLIDEELSDVQQYIASVEKGLNDLNAEINKNPVLATTIGKKSASISANLQNLKNYISVAQSQQATQEKINQAQNNNVKTIQQPVKPVQQVQPQQAAPIQTQTQSSIQQNKNQPQQFKQQVIKQ